MKSLIVALMTLATSSALAFSGQQDVNHDSPRFLKNCGGTVHTKCTSGDKCWVNIRGTQCKGVRLYDTVNLLNGYYTEVAGQTYKTELSGSAGNYYTADGQLYVDKSKFRYSWAQGEYYVPLFVYRTDRNEPYDKGLLWFTHR